MVKPDLPTGVVLVQTEPEMSTMFLKQCFNAIVSEVSTMFLNRCFKGHCLWSITWSFQEWHCCSVRRNKEHAFRLSARQFSGCVNSLIYAVCCQYCCLASLYVSLAVWSPAACHGLLHVIRFGWPLLGRPTIRWFYQTDQADGLSENNYLVDEPTFWPAVPRLCSIQKCGLFCPCFYRTQCPQNHTLFFPFVCCFFVITWFAIILFLSYLHSRNQ